MGKFLNVYPERRRRGLQMAAAVYSHIDPGSSQIPDLIHHALGRSTVPVVNVIKDRQLRCLSCLLEEGVPQSVMIHPVSSDY